MAIERAVELANDHQAIFKGIAVIDTRRIKKAGSVPPSGDAYAEKPCEKRVEITEQRVENAIQKSDRPLFLAQ